MTNNVNKENCRLGELDEYCEGCGSNLYLCLECGWSGCIFTPISRSHRDLEVVTSEVK